MATAATCLPTLEHERVFLEQGYALVAGVDEVGRGAWAGPVVAAAVMLPLNDEVAMSRLLGTRDSKQLSADERCRLSAVIQAVAVGIGFGWATHHVVDRQGLGAANRLALQRAVRALRPAPNALILDYFHLPTSALPQLAVVHGDSVSLSIAAASVVAKVFRDRWMERCATRFPSYGFERHKGYGTAQHRQALDIYGPSPLHRRSFVPVAARCM